jgi:hypothetical protein
LRMLVQVSCCDSGGGLAKKLVLGVVLGVQWLPLLRAQWLPLFLCQCSDLAS